MILNFDNEIDKKMSEIYSEEIISNATKDTLEYIGMNISEAPDDDIQLKIYYDNKPSRELYQKLGDKEPLIEFLYKKGMITGLEIVHDKKNTRCTRYNIKLKYRYKNNMLELFSWMENNIKFFSKYKDEIMKLSEMKYTEDEDGKYASLFFMGVEKNGDEISILKLYWIKHPEFAKEYIQSLQECDIPQLKELLPITFNAVENCGGNFIISGINYNENSSEKHKYYIECPTNLYDGLIKTFPDNTNLIRKLNKIRDWHEIHPEYICDGFAIGKNSQNQFVLKFYFMFKNEK
jgi:hypothetical protein